VNHRERYGKGKVEVFWRQNPLIVQNDAGREQDVDEQVDISEKKRFVDHHFFCFCFGGLDKRGQRKKEKGFSSELKTC